MGKIWVPGSFIRIIETESDHGPSLWFYCAQILSNALPYVWEHSRVISNCDGVAAWVAPLHGRMFFYLIANVWCVHFVRLIRLPQGVGMTSVFTQKRLWPPQLSALKESGVHSISFFVDSLRIFKYGRRRYVKSFVHIFLYYSQPIVGFILLWFLVFAVVFGFILLGISN